MFDYKITAENAITNYGRECYYNGSTDTTDKIFKILDKCLDKDLANKIKVKINQEIDYK